MTKDNYQDALIAGATEEAKWDGRTFSGLSASERKRYVDRFEAGLIQYFNALELKLPTTNFVSKSVDKWEVVNGLNNGNIELNSDMKLVYKEFD